MKTEISVPVDELTTNRRWGILQRAINLGLNKVPNGQITNIREDGKNLVFEVRSETSRAIVAKARTRLRMQQDL